MIEYALNVYNNKGFLYQVDVFSTLREAIDYKVTHELEDENEYYKIVCIKYDEHEQEISLDFMFD